MIKTVSKVLVGLALVSSLAHALPGLVNDGGMWMANDYSFQDKVFNHKLKFLGTKKFGKECESKFIVEGHETTLYGCPKNKNVFKGSKGKLLNVKYIVKEMDEGMIEFYLKSVKK